MENVTYQINLLENLSVSLRHFFKDYISFNQESFHVLIYIYPYFVFKISLVYDSMYSSNEIKKK